MMASRHAGSPRSRAARTTLMSVIVGLSAALVATLGVLAGAVFALARRVVAPAVRIPDTRVLAVDTKAQTITLSRTPDTELPGRYGLITSGTEPYLKLGSVLAEDAHTVKRKLLTQLDQSTRLAPDASFSGWYFDRPEQLQLPFFSGEVPGPAGPCPAWLFPAPEPAATWVIQVHGRGTQRTECLRAVPVFRAAGITTLLVSYRNDGEAPRSRTGTSGLGAFEWRDVDAAVAYAHENGAKHVVLMGWSMGGAIVLQTSLLSSHRDLIAGLILDSPVVDWRTVLRFQAQLAHVPRPVSGITMDALERQWAPYVVRSESPIPFDDLDIVARAGELRQPILILHSDDDGFVPSDASHALAQARPDLVELDVFTVARHTKLWNYDPDRWTTAITSWLERQGLTTSQDVGN